MTIRTPIATQTDTRTMPVLALATAPFFSLLPGLLPLGPVVLWEGAVVVVPGDTVIRSAAAAEAVGAGSIVPIGEKDR
jgi:hypothetical protein